MGKGFRAVAWRLRQLFPIADIVKITVRDDRFQPIRTLESVAELEAFGDFWSHRAEADFALWPSPGLRSPYKIDIHRFDARKAKRSASRWLYDPAGLARLLGIWRPLWIAPLYRLPDPADFNKLLGVDP
jgi:hypothetical protein